MRKGRSKAKKELNDESEADSYITDNEDITILDYIIIET